MWAIVLGSSHLAYLVAVLFHGQNQIMKRVGHDELEPTVNTAYKKWRMSHIDTICSALTLSEAPAYSRRQHS